MNQLEGGSCGLDSSSKHNSKVSSTQEERQQKSNRKKNLSSESADQEQLPQPKEEIKSALDDKQRREAKVNALKRIRLNVKETFFKAVDRKVAVDAEIQANDEHQHEQKESDNIQIYSDTSSHLPSSVSVISPTIVSPRSSSNLKQSRSPQLTLQTCSPMKRASKDRDPHVDQWNSFVKQVECEPSETSSKKQSMKTSALLFEEEYEILKDKLGEGCHGDVRKCRRRSDNRIFAVKVIRNGDTEIILSAITSFNIARDLHHPSVIKPQELFVDRETEKIFYVMEYCEYSSLQIFFENLWGISPKKARRNRRLPSIRSFSNHCESPQLESNSSNASSSTSISSSHRQNGGTTKSHSLYCHQPHIEEPELSLCRNILKEILTAVAFLHKEGICHRDLKPDNILVSDSCEKVKVIDFEISKRFKYLRANKQSVIKVSEMWTRTGTQDFMSPEMFMSTGYSESVDIWAVGVIAYQLLTGRLPFEQEYISDKIEFIREAKYNQEPLNRVDDIAKDLIKRMLKKDPMERLSADDALAHPWFLYSNLAEARLRSEQNLYKSTCIKVYKNFHSPLNLDKSHNFDDFHIKTLDDYKYLNKPSHFLNCQNSHLQQEEQHNNHHQMITATTTMTNPTEDYAESHDKKPHKLLYLQHISSSGDCSNSKFHEDHNQQESSKKSLEFIQKVQQFKESMTEGMDSIKFIHINQKRRVHPKVSQLRLKLLMEKPKESVAEGAAAAVLQMEIERTTMTASQLTTVGVATGIAADAAAAVSQSGASECIEGRDNNGSEEIINFRSRSNTNTIKPQKWGSQINGESEDVIVEENRAKRLSEDFTSSCIIGKVKPVGSTATATVSSVAGSSSSSSSSYTPNMQGSVNQGYVKPNRLSQFSIGQEDTKHHTLLQQHKHKESIDETANDGKEKSKYFSLFPNIMHSIELEGKQVQRQIMFVQAQSEDDGSDHLERTQIQFRKTTSSSGEKEHIQLEEQIQDGEVE